LIRIYPFSALYPTSEFASQVATRVLGSETDEEIKLYFEQNPFSFLHITQPHVHFAEPKSENEMHFGFAKNYFNQLQEQKVLVQDEDASIYIYRQTLADGYSFTGLIAGISAIDYLDGSVKKHEYTISEKENYMAKHLLHTGVVAEPVLLSCPEIGLIEHWIGENLPETPLYSFKTDNGSNHTLWKVKNESAIEEICKLMKDSDSLYIADGHHRIAATTDYLAQMHNEHNWKSNQMFFMGLIIPEQELRINSFHRLVTNISDAEISAMLIAIQDTFDVEKINEQTFVPKNKGEFGLCTRQGWYRLSFKYPSDYGSPSQNLDVSRLEKYIFSRVLKIHDSKADPRLQFVRGDMPARDLETLVHAGSIDLAFLVFPNTMLEIKEVADADETMPPKSTWIKPKLLTGMIVLRFTE